MTIMNSICFAKTAFFKVEMDMPAHLRIRDDWMLQCIHEDEDSPVKPMFCRMAKVILTGSCLVLYESTRTRSGPIASLLLKNFKLKSNGLTIMLLPIDGPHASPVYLTLRRQEDLLQWKSLLLQLTTPSSFNVYSNNFRRQFQADINDLKETKTSLVKTKDFKSFRKFFIKFCTRRK